MSQSVDRLFSSLPKTNDGTRKGTIPVIKDPEQGNLSLLRLVPSQAKTPLFKETDTIHVKVSEETQSKHRANEVQSAECRVQSAECRVQSAECVRRRNTYAHTHSHTHAHTHALAETQDHHQEDCEDDEGGRGDSQEGGGEER